MLVVVALAMLASFAVAPRRDVGGQEASATSAGPRSVKHEQSEDDPPREPKHQASPAKKPRLKALLVQTAPPANPAQPLAFGLFATEIAPALANAIPHAEPESGSRREDPVLRLHRGQAPPRHVA